MLKLQPFLCFHAQKSDHPVLPSKKNVPNRPAPPYGKPPLPPICSLPFWMCVLACVMYACPNMTGAAPCFARDDRICIITWDRLNCQTPVESILPHYFMMQDVHYDRGTTGSVMELCVLKLLRNPRWMYNYYFFKFKLLFCHWVNWELAAHSPVLNLANGPRRAERQSNAKIAMNNLLNK